MLIITSQSMLFIVLFCVIVFMSLTAVLPLIVALSHYYLHILLRNFFLCDHCNSFLSVLCILSSVSYHGCTYDAAVGIQKLTHLSINDVNNFLLLGNAICSEKFNSIWLFYRLITSTLDLKSQYRLLPWGIGNVSSTVGRE